ncbi:MAG: glutathione synthase [Candidatus Hydrogenedentota bacterium]|nr:MAG: glutathione synthase [Candidatus Hydrogenedentota bacterium]
MTVKRVLILADPPEKLVPPGDTTLRLVAEGLRRRIRFWHADHGDLEVANGRPEVLCRAFGLTKTGFPRLSSSHRRKRLAEFDVVLFRKDPPFDLSYLHATRIVELDSEPIVINSPAGLRKANEKLYALNFPEAMPPTLVTADRDRALAFLAEQKRLVAKPLDSFGGIGVVLLRYRDRGARALLDLMTAEGNSAALFQKYVSGVDKRVFVIDGKVEGVMIRCGVKNDFRANMHVGGQPVLSCLTRTEQRRLKPVLEKLIQDGILFAGLDLIGGFLSEVNVTSPTGFWHYQHVSGIDLSERFWDTVERLMHRRKAPDGGGR